ncbi:MAG: glycosyltransferase family 1 protein [Bacteroidetes bacterium]|nr:glycosyltransferase family 1 protein [Bacteroidota bacterium]
MIKENLKKYLPKGIIQKSSFLRQSFRRPIINNAIGELSPFLKENVFVQLVGNTFNQNFPNAMMVARMGYCNGFEKLGLPYIIIDINKAPGVLKSLPNPFCMVNSIDLIGTRTKLIDELSKYPIGVWVHPWFENSKDFFSQHNLDYKIWDLDSGIKKKIFRLNPKFGFTATVERGLTFFQEWEKHGLKIFSLPLACDTKAYAYNPSKIYKDFEQVELAFVGGYWPSKGVQIDKYLRSFEEKLTIYGYNQWPYKGYKGLLSLEKESSLYFQAKVCPVINEPTVALLKGQINERVFKILGSGGCPIVDAVPSYLDLFSSDELLIAKNPVHYKKTIHQLLNDQTMNKHFRSQGHKATLAKHTYAHRAIKFLEFCGLEHKQYRTFL